MAEVWLFNNLCFFLRCEDWLNLLAMHFIVVKLVLLKGTHFLFLLFNSGNLYFNVMYLFLYFNYLFFDNFDSTWFFLDNFDGLWLSLDDFDFAWLFSDDFDFAWFFSDDFDFAWFFSYDFDFA